MTDTLRERLLEAAAAKDKAVADCEREGKEIIAEAKVNGDLEQSAPDDIDRPCASCEDDKAVAVLLREAAAALAAPAATPKGPRCIDCGNGVAGRETELCDACVEKNNAKADACVPAMQESIPHPGDCWCEACCPAPAGGAAPCPHCEYSYGHKPGCRTRCPRGEPVKCRLCEKPQPCPEHGRTPVTAADFEELSRDVAGGAEPPACTCGMNPSIRSWHLPQCAIRCAERGEVAGGAEPPVLASMRLASAQVDDAKGPGDYHARLVALALIARQYLRELPAGGATPPEPHPLACQNPACGHSRLAHGQYDRCSECLCRRFEHEKEASYLADGDDNGPFCRPPATTPPEPPQGWQPPRGICDCGHAVTEHGDEYVPERAHCLIPGCRCSKSRREVMAPPQAEAKENRK